MVMHFRSFAEILIWRYLFRMTQTFINAQKLTCSLQLSSSVAPAISPVSFEWLKGDCLSLLFLLGVTYLSNPLLAVNWLGNKISINAELREGEGGNLVGKNQLSCVQCCGQD